jgi:hypothetical protein
VQATVQNLQQRMDQEVYSDLLVEGSGR